MYVTKCNEHGDLSGLLSGLLQNLHCRMHDIHEDSGIISNYLKDLRNSVEIQDICRMFYLEPSETFRIEVSQLCQFMIGNYVLSSFRVLLPD